MPLHFRKAVPADVPACVELRGKTRENAFSVEQLNAAGVTEASWRDAVADGGLPGHVCTSDNDIVGYCFGDGTTGEVVVLALLPTAEGRGVGKHLLNLVLQDLSQLGFRRFVLGCSSNPAHRSYGFYRHLGWVSTGTVDAAGDEVLEYFPELTDKAHA